jgi:hypothetical protein
LLGCVDSEELAWKKLDKESAKHRIWKGISKGGAADHPLSTIHRFPGTVLASETSMDPELGEFKRGTE